MNNTGQDYGITRLEDHITENSIISELIEFSIKNIEGNFSNRFLTQCHIIINI